MAEYEVTYQLQDDDYRALARFLIFGTRRGRRIMRRNDWASIGLLIFAAACLYWVTQDPVFTFLLTAACGVGFLYLRKTNRRTLVERVFRAIRPANEHRMKTQSTIKLMPDAIHARHGEHSGTIKWQGVSDLGQDDDHIFFVLGRKNAFVVPKRQFASSEEFDGFLQQAHAYWTQSWGIPTKATPQPEPRGHIDEEKSQ